MNNLTAVVGAVRFDGADIGNTIKWAIYQYDRIRPNAPDRVERIQKREMLLKMIRSASWFPIENDEVRIITRSKNDWMKSLPMWMTFQRELDDYLTNEEEKEEPKKKEKPETEPELKPKRKRKQNESPPKIKNLAVIPKCE